MKPTTSSPRFVAVATEVVAIQSRRATIVARLNIIETEQLKLETELSELSQKQHALELESAKLAGTK